MIIFQNDSLTVFQSALFQTNSAIVEGDGFVLVVDPTWLPSEVEEIAAYVRNIRLSRPLYLLSRTRTLTIFSVMERSLTPSRLPAANL